MLAKSAKTVPGVFSLRNRFLLAQRGLAAPFKLQVSLMRFVGKPFLFKRSRGTLWFVMIAAIVCGAFFWKSVRKAPLQSRIEAGAAFLQDDQFSAAQSQLQDAVQLDPHSAQAWELLGDLYLKTRDHPSAQKAFNRAIAEGATTSGVEAKAAFCALQSQNFKAARGFSEAALARNADDVDALGVLARVEKHDNHPDTQLQLLERLVALQPRDAEALRDLATELSLRQKFERLLPIAQMLVEVEPNSSTSYFLRGLARFNADSTASSELLSESDFQRASELAPRDGEAHRFLARLYLRQNQPQKAIDEYQILGQLRPYASAHLLELSQALRRAGRTQEAIQAQALFSHLKETNRQMLSLRDRVALFPKDPTHSLRMAALLLRCVQGGDADFQLYRFHFLKGELQSVSDYSDHALQVSPQGVPEKNMVRQVEQTYAQQLRLAQDKLLHYDFAGADGAMARAILIRPRDERTARVLARFTTLNRDPLGKLLPHSPTDAFFK